MPSLGNDLAEIRRNLGLSIDDVHQSTKIPMHIIEAIENDSIFTDLEENITYIRSYIRSYSKAVKIDEKVIVKALDDMEAGIYSGLAPHKEVAGEEDQQAEPDADAGEEKKQAGAPAGDMVHDHAPDEHKSQEQFKSPLIREKVPPPPTVSSVDWAQMGRKFIPLQSKSRLWISFLFLFILIGAVLFFVLYDFEGSFMSGNSRDTGTPTETAQPGLVPDSLQIDLRNSEERESLPQDVVNGERLSSLPDTLRILIYAAYDKLEPVRVYTDVMDDTNPYWIEQGEAFRFEFVNMIRLRGQYSRMVLLLNGHVIENFRNQFYNPETRMVEINRTFFEGNGRWLTPPPESLAIDAPPPAVVRDRPRFN